MCSTTSSGRTLRSAGQIRDALILLRFKKRIPFAKIMRDAGVNPDQLKAAYAMEASETVQRRLDAYLDAGQLHHVDSLTALQERIKEMTRELWNTYKAQSIPIDDVARLSPDKQKQLAHNMNYRLKKLLREKMEREHPGTKFYFADGEPYWKAKKRMEARAATADGNDGSHRNRTGSSR